MWDYNLEEVETQDPPVNNIQVESMVAETDYSCYGWSDDDFGSNLEFDIGDDNLDEAGETHEI